MDLCDKCGMPAVEYEPGHWTHAEVADGVFCALVMGGPPIIIEEDVRGA